MNTDQTISHVRAHCVLNRVEFSIRHDGSMWLHGLQINTASLAAAIGPVASDTPAGVTLHAEGYEPLADVLARAFHQAASGKGKERHAQGEPFTGQVMQDMARRFGVGALLGQAFKKSEESQRLPLDRAVAELLGAINYLAGAVIALECRGTGVAEKSAVNTKPANDNPTRPCCCGGHQNAARCSGCDESFLFGNSQHARR